MERLKRLYLGLPPALRGAVPGRLEAWARDRLLPALDRTRGARGLEDKLWGGFSRPARAGLAALMADPAAPPREAAAAALALARWYGATGDFEAALACVVAARHRRPGLARDRRQQLLEALFLTRLGRVAEARALLSGAGSSVAFLRANTCNPAVAGTSGDAAAALAEINAVFRRFGLTEIARADPAAWLALGNLRGIAEPGSIDGPLVSVIVPVHDAAPTLGWALASLAAQTWARLEVLVVDDASRDGSAAVAAAFAARDPRFRLLRQPTNLGGYAARNRALGEAAGAFVTVQDADDWAHPEKIARHVADLDRRRLPLNLSAWVRATDALLFWGPWQPSPNLPAPNLSSVFFRRELVAAAGPWDTARVGADREFVARVERLHGLALQRPFLPDCPLAFGRDGSGSLTRGGVADAASALHGVRREYHEAFALWHADLDPAALPAAAPPFFPAPAAIRAAAGDEPERDLLLIGDFNLRGGTHQSAMHMLRAAGDAGLTAAILHYRRPDLDVTRPLAAAVRRFAQANAVRIVAPGEAVAARTVVVTYPPVFAEALDRFPAVAHVTLAVVVNQMAERDLDRRDVVYDPAAVRATLRRAPRWRGALDPDLGAGAGADGGRSALPAPAPRHLDAADRPRGERPHPGLARPGKQRGAAAAGDRPARPRPSAEMAGRSARPRRRLLRRSGLRGALPRRRRPCPGAARALAAQLARRRLRLARRAGVPRRARSLPALPRCGLHRGVRPRADGGDGRRGAGDPAARVRADLRRRRALCRARGSLAAGAGALARPRRLGGAGGGGARLRRRRMRLPRLPAAARPAGGTGRERRPGARRRRLTLAAPRFSVIVPVWRQWDAVPALLAGLAVQDPPGGFEILIVNNEAPASRRRSPCRRTPGCCPARPPAPTRRATPAPRRRGAPGWCFTDADCRPEPGWLAAFAAAAAADPAALLAGPVRMTAPPEPNAFAIYDLVRGIPQAAYVARGYAATANLAVPAAVFAGLGGFEAGRFSGGDAVFCRRAGRAGHEIRLVPGAVVAHPARTGWDALAAKARRIRGGQVAAGPLPRRIAWLIRGLSPPVRDAVAYLGADQPPRYRRHRRRRAPAALDRRVARDRPPARRRNPGTAVSSEGLIVAARQR